MFVLGTVGDQMERNHARSEGDAEDLTRLFGALILAYTFLSPFFGKLVDRLGMAFGFALVNTLGLLCYATLNAR